MQRSSGKRAAASFGRASLYPIPFRSVVSSPYIASIDTNPARFSPTLASLFPPGALAAELRESADPALLWPAEAMYLGKAVAKRAQEFAAGRLCARKLLAEFGIREFPVEVGDARQPLWPDALVGSITHTAGFCAAVVAEQSRFAAIGVDSEVAGSVKPEVWPSICTPGEILWLHSLPEASRMGAATLIFSAKEAFYKCQYPLTRERLTFHDAQVELAWVASGGSFTIQPTKRITLADHAALPLHGRYLFHEQFVTAGLSLSAAAVSDSDILRQ
jgi:4'-phosphopantetheinyl transferase EntD